MNIGKFKIHARNFITVEMKRFGCVKSTKHCDPRTSDNEPCRLTITLTLYIELMIWHE